MSEALWGVLVGGILSGIGTWVSVGLEHRRRVRETRIARLDAKRIRLEAAFDRIAKDLVDAMRTNSYPITILSDFAIALPENVRAAFLSWMDDKSKTAEKARAAYLDITMEMKSALKAIDDEIDCAIGK